jgi:thymidylate synthase (FAD)
MKPIFLYDDDIGKVEYVQHMGDDITIVNSARVSFGKHKESIDEKDKKLINYLVKHRHTSTFEHNVVTFRCKVPLFVRSQHHRHRTWSYNEISRRYTSVDMSFYSPDKFRTQHKSNRQSSNLDQEIDPVLNSSYLQIGYENASNAVKMHHSRSISLYNAMLDAGICREQARGVLPQNLYTEYYATCNLSNLIKFIDLRTHEGAQLEIQKLAEGMLAIAKNLWPIAINSYKVNTNDG